MLNEWNRSSMNVDSLVQCYAWGAVPARLAEETTEEEVGK